MFTAQEKEFLHKIFAQITFPCTQEGADQMVIARSIINKLSDENSTRNSS